MGGRLGKIEQQLEQERVQTGTKREIGTATASILVSNVLCRVKTAFTGPQRLESAISSV